MKNIVAVWAFTVIPLSLSTYKAVEQNTHILSNEAKKIKEKQLTFSHISLQHANDMPFFPFFEKADRFFYQHYEGKGNGFFQLTEW